MTINYEVSSIFLGQKEYQVIRPDITLSDLYIVQLQDQNHIIFGNENSLPKLASIFEYASNDSQSIIYINSRVNELTEYLRNGWSNNSKPLDLVILHHSIQLKTHEWKRIRDLWKKTVKQRKSSIIQTNVEEKHRKQEYYYKENKDVLDIDARFETLFLIGSRTVFNDISKDALSVSENGRELYLRHPGYHDHEHIDYYARRVYTKNYKYDGHFLCIDYYDRDLWER